MTAPDIAALLDVLCTELGVCLSIDHRDRLLGDPPTTPSAFTHAVMRAEASDPTVIDAMLYRQVHTRVLRAFDRGSIG